MNNFSKYLKQQEKGQGMTEYALILVLVPVVTIIALMLLGPLIGEVFSEINNSLVALEGGGGEIVSVPLPTELPTEEPACSSTPAFEAWKSSMNSQCSARPGVGQFVQFSCNESANTTSATCFVASRVGQTPNPYNQGSFSH